MVERTETSPLSDLNTGENQPTEARLTIAQADTPPTDQPAQPPEPQRIIIALEDGPLVRLPEGASIEAPRVNGTNLEFVQPDGTVLVVPEGAVTGLTIFIGTVEIPPLAVSALFETNNIEAAAGPEQSGTPGSGGNFAIVPGGIGDGGLGTTDLLGNTTGGRGAAGGTEFIAANLAPTIVGDLTISLSEEGLALGNPDNVGTPDTTNVASVSGTLDISDPNPGDTLTVALGIPTTPLASGGAPIVWTLTGQTLTGMANGTTVISATIDDAGNYTIALFAPIDHPDTTTEDALTLSIPITVTDFEGLSSSANLVISIDDDAPVSTHGDRYVTLNEADIDDSTATHTRDFNNIDFGADGYGETYFTGQMGFNIGGTMAGNITFNVDGGPVTVNEVTSGGKPLVFEKVDANSIRGYIVDDSGAEIEIIELKLNDTDAGVTATLLGPIDHLDVGSDDPLTELRLDATVAFEDGDGDTVTSILRVNINDDGPVLIGNASGKVFENDLDIDGFPIILEGSTGSSPNDGNTHQGPAGPSDILGFLLQGSTAATGDLSAIVDFGADGEGSFRVHNADEVIDTGQKSKGEEVSQIAIELPHGTLVLGFVSSADDASIETLVQFLEDTLAGAPVEPDDLSNLADEFMDLITSDPRLVYGLNLNASGEYSFHLFDQLDHTRSNPDSLALDFSSLFEAVDGDGDAIALPEDTFTITIADDAPIVGDVTAAMGENQVVEIPLDFELGADENGTVILGAPSIASGVAGLDISALTIARVDQSVHIDPGSAFDALPEGATATLTIPYTVTDKDGDAVTKSVTLTITGTNDGPVAKDFVSPFTFLEDTSNGPIDFGTIPSELVSDVDTPMSHFTASAFAIGDVSIAGGPAMSAALAGISVDAGGKITIDTNVAAYQHLGVGDTANVVVDFTVTDDGGLSDQGTVTFKVSGTNDAPVGATDSFTSNEDTLLTGNVLTNDTDVEGDPLTASLVTGPSNGTLTLNDDGSFTYTPRANYNGPDSFTYKANDGTADSTPVTVNLDIAPVNDAPVATDDTIITNFSGAPTGPETAPETPEMLETGDNNYLMTQAQEIVRGDLKVAENGNPDLGATNQTLPSIAIKGEIGSFWENGSWDAGDFYKIDLKSGETLILDVDNTSGWLNANLKIYDADGNEVANDRDSRPSDGGNGSPEDYVTWFGLGDSMSWDPYLSFTPTEDGAYYIKVGRGAFAGEYDLNISIDNFHPEPPASEAITISVDTLLANDFDPDIADTLTLTAVSGTGVTLNGDTITIDPTVTEFDYTITDGNGGSTTATVSVQTATGNLTGDAADNILVGGQGDDFLVGGDGDDILVGRPGNDTLTGGNGGDTFAFTDTGAANADTITDYVAGQDEIDLTTLLDDNFSQGDIGEYVKIVDQSPDSGHDLLQISQDNGATWEDVAILDDIAGGIVNVKIDDSDYDVGI